MNRQKRAITLIELLVAIALSGLLIVGISSLNTFAQFHLMTSVRRAQVQNEASLVLEHMAKNIAQGIGSLNMPAAVKHDSEEWIKVRWDRNSNGQPDNDDGWIAYRYIPAQNEIQYHANYSASSWPTTGGEVISRKVTYFSCGITDNYIFADITACVDPDGDPNACGNIDNPQVEMKCRIKMPGVSVN